MPQNALIARYDAIEMGVGGGFSLPGSGEGEGDFGASYEAVFAPDVIDLATSILIQIGATTDSGGSWFASYDGPNAPFGGYSQGGSGLPSDLSCFARFLNVTLYSRFSAADVLFSWTGIEIRINGSLVVTLGAGDSASTPHMGLGPMGVFPHSGVAYVSGGAGGSAALPPDGTPSGSGSIDVGGTVTGGYRYLIDGVWHALPTSQPPPETEPPTSGPGHNGPGGVGPSISAPFGLSFPDAVSSTSTWGSQLVSRYHYDYSFTRSPGGFPYTSYHNEETSGGSIVLIPDPPRALNRINPDFLASVWHWGTPQVRGYAVREFSQFEPYPDDAHPDASPVLYAHEGYGSEELGNSAGVADAYCARPAYLCVDVSVGKSVYDRGATSSSSGYTHDRQENLRYQVPYFDSDDSVEHGSTPYQEHAKPLARYFGSSICHPFWSLGYVPGDWNLDGSPQRWATDPEDPTDAGYWGYVREQYLAAQMRRNHVVSCPLEVDNWQQFLDAYNRTSDHTSGFRWLGISRWLTQEVSPPVSVATDATGSDAWRSLTPSCSLTFDAAGVHLHGAPGSTVTLRVDLGRFDRHPYLYPMVCDRVALGWEAANIDSVTAFAATSFGDRAEFVGLASGVVQRIPRGKSSRYAGSWGYDDGAGIAGDGGTDAKPAGLSSPLSYDPENSLMYRLLEAGSPGLLEIEVRLTEAEGTETTVDATLHWPTWYRAEGTRRLEAESGMVQSLVYADGPGIRVGNQTWYDPAVGLVNPPETYGLGAKWTVLDWLAFKRLCLLAQPFDGGTPDLTTELTQVYDPYEVQSVGASSFGNLVFVLPSSGPEWRAALVNAIGEIPPLAAYPGFSRNADWSRGSFGDAGVWAWAQGPRRIVAAGTTPMHMAKPDGTVSTTTTSLGPSGWSIAEHSPVVDNTESPNWQLKAGGDVFGLATPWHGWFWAGATPSARLLALLHRRDGRLFRVVDKDGTANLGRSDVPGRASWAERDLAASATEASLARGEGGAPVVGLLHGGTVTLRVEASQGFDAPSTIMDLGSATSHDQDAFGDGRIAVGRIDGGRVKLTLVSTRDLSIVAGPFDTNVTGLPDDATIRVRTAPQAGNRPGLLVIVGHGGDTTAYLTTDLLTLNP